MANIKLWKLFLSSEILNYIPLIHQSQKRSIVCDLVNVCNNQTKLKLTCVLIYWAHTTSNFTWCNYSIKIMLLKVTATFPLTLCYSKSSKTVRNVKCQGHWILSSHKLSKISLTWSLKKKANAKTICHNRQDAHSWHIYSNDFFFTNQDLHIQQKSKQRCCLFPTSSVFSSRLPCSSSSLPACRREEVCYKYTNN